MKKSVLALITILFTLVFTNKSFGQHNHDHGNHEPSDLFYIQNNGQWNEDVLYKSTMNSGAVFLEKNCFTFSQLSAQDLEKRHDYYHNDKAALETLVMNGHAWKTKFVDANSNATISGFERRSEYYNFFIGSDEKKWAGNVPAFDGVSYSGLYSGIDLNVYSIEGNMKYDFIINAGADAGQVKISYDGLSGVRLEEGNIVLETSIGNFIEMAPVAYQIIDGNKKNIPCNYLLVDGVISFDFPEGYNKTVELVIDPVLVAATLSGSGADNYGHCATYDNAGNIYTGAINFGFGYPVTVGVFQVPYGGGGTDIVVSRLNPTGTTLLYATHLGGNGADYPHSMIVSNSGELYVMGTSSSSNYPISVGGYDNSLGGTTDIVVTHFSADASSIIGSTYVGGTGVDGNNSVTFNYGDNFRGEIILDAADNCYLASTTTSNNFPVTLGAHQTLFGGSSDAVFFSLNANLSAMNWSTYLGGTGGESGFGLRLDDLGHVYGCGAANQSFMTATGYVPNFQGVTDGFIVEISDNGETIARSTYWGTNDEDNAFFLDIDDDGFIYIYGQSNGGTSQVTSGVYSNPSSGQYIAKLDSTLNTLGFATVIGNGGSNEFVPIAFMVDGCGYIYFSGHSASPSMPLTAGWIQNSDGFYLGVLDPNATGLYYSTYFGGPGDHVDGGTSRFDPNGIVYQGVCTGGGFNTTPGAWSDTQSGWDVGVFKINFEVNPLQASAGASPAASGCAPFNVTFDNTSTGVTYEWDFGDGSPVVTDFEPSHVFTLPGTYDVMLIAHDPSACNQYDTTYLVIVVGSNTAPSAQITFTADCATGSIDVSNVGSSGETFEWDMGDGTTYTGPTASHTYSTTGTYTVTLTATNSMCGVLTDVATVDVPIGSAPMSVIYNNPVCYQFSDGSVTLDVDGTTGSETYTIENAAGTQLNLGGSNTANNLVAGWYYYTVDLGNGCVSSDSVELINPAQLDVLLQITNPLCFGLQTGVVIVDTVLNWQGSYANVAYFWNPNPGSVSGLGADTATNYGAGTYTLTINDQNGCSNVFDFIVTQPDQLIFTEFGSDPAYCRVFDFQSGHGVVFAAATGGTPDYTYLWTNLQTGATSNNTTWGGLNPGFYQMIATDDNGCMLIDTAEVIEVDPIADFTLSSPEFTAQYEGTAPVTVTFSNQSLYYANPNDPNADTTFFWNFNFDNSTWVISHDINETFDTTYTEGGTYTVCLVAINKNGCTDTMCVDIIIYDPMVFAPINVFTPDGDGVNDEFTFIFRSDAIKVFSCIVVNRWGVVMAEFDDIQDTWDGRDKNGDLCKDGVYFYNYQGEADNGELLIGQGTVTLINGKK